MKPTKRAVAIVAVVIIIVAGLIGYSEFRPTTRKVIDTLVIDENLWPSTDQNALTLFEIPFPWWQGTYVYQPLVAVNLNESYGSGVIQYTPGLATNWTQSADGSTFTFNLRQNVTFSNGDPFNAYQVWMEMYGFYYLTGNSSTWLESYDIFDMSNVAFGPATISLISRSGLINPSQEALNIMMNNSWPIYVTSPTQIAFHLKSPFIYFPGTLVALEGEMFDTQYVLNNGGFGTPTSINSNFNQHPIPGTGPYMVTDVSEGAYVQFTQNPNYWGANLSQSEVASNPMLDPGHVKNVIIYFKPDDLSRYTDLSNGAAQIALIEQSDWNLVMSNPDKYSYFSMPPWAGACMAVALNTHRYPTNITDVRLAIVHAINYTDMYEKAVLGYASPFVGPEYPAWKDFYDLGGYPLYSYNITLANQYLKEANLTSMPTLTFTEYSPCQMCINAATVVQADLAQIGIRVNIQMLSSYTAYTEAYGAYSWEVQNVNQLGDITLLGANYWAPNTLTPADYWVSFVSNQSWWGNMALYSNPTVQAAVNAFTNSSNPAQLKSLVAKAQAQIYNDAPYSNFASLKLFYVAGSVVSLKQVINSYYMDPVWTGEDSHPLINTVTFESSGSAFSIESGFFITYTVLGIQAINPELILASSYEQNKAQSFVSSN